MLTPRTLTRHVWLPIGLAIALGLTLAAAAPAGTLDDDVVPYEEFAKGWLKAHKVNEVSELPMEKVRSEHCIHGVLGAIDFAFPTAFLTEKDRCEALKKCCTSLLDLQQKWIEWLATDTAKIDAGKADVAELKTWVKSWKQPALAKAISEADKDVFKVLDAKEAQTQAAARLSELLLKPDVLGIAPSEGQPLRILFSPSRRDFVELVGYAGLQDPAKQTELWHPITTEWTNFWIGWDFVMAMEYPPWAPDPEYRTCLPMDKFDKTGLEQHTVLQAANALQWMCYGEDGAPAFHQAVAMNLAIAVCGELNALEGDGWGYGTTGAKTRPYERFVPGGNSAGGILPPMPAIGGDAAKKGRWREDLGKEHFAPPLRKGQKNGFKFLAKDGAENLDPKVAEDKNAHFYLVAPDESAKYVVSAPFFGEAAKSKPYPPTAVILDYREFFRAYKSSFFHWLQTQFDPKDPAASAAKFRDLMKKMSGRTKEEPFDPVVQEVYGVALSGPNGETDSLEWRFLDWLGKGK